MRTDHVFFTRRVALRGWLVAAALAVLSLTAQARYVSPTPPAGFAPGSGGGFVYTPPTPLEQLDSIRKESAGKPTGWYRTPGPTLPSGGGKPPAAMRFGSGAARALAGATARQMAGLAARSMTPAGLALGGAWLLYNCFDYQGGQWVRTCGAGAEPLPESDGRLYRVATQWGGPAWSSWHPTTQMACQEAFQISHDHKPAGWIVEYEGVRPGGGCYWKASNPYNTMVYSASVENKPSTCPAGSFVGSSGHCYAEQPTQNVTIPQIEDEMELKPLPNVLPAFVPYPLWSPADGSLTPSVFGHPTVVNPNRTYEDSTTPSPQKWRQPQGSPKLNPETGKVEQPVTDWKHKPTDSDPFQMETEPGKVETTDPEGQTEPGTAEEGEPSTPKPESDTQDLCEKNPGILACADVPELDTPEGEIPRDSETITFAPESVLGGGSCPAERSLGGSYTFSYADTCNALTTYVRPLVIAIAGWMAIVIIFGIGRPEV